MNENTPDPDFADENPDADFDAEPDQSEEPLNFPTDGFGPAAQDDIPSADVTTEAQHKVQT